MGAVSICGQHRLLWRGRVLKEVNTAIDHALQSAVERDEIGGISSATAAATAPKKTALDAALGPETAGCLLTRRGRAVAATPLRARLTGRMGDVCARKLVSALES